MKEKNIFESLEMLNSPHDHSPPKEGLFQRQLLPASVHLRSPACRYAEESLGPTAQRAHEDSHEEMIPYLLLSPRRQSHPVTTPYPLNCCSG